MLVGYMNIMVTDSLAGGNIYFLSLHEGLSSDAGKSQVL